MSSKKSNPFKESLKVKVKPTKAPTMRQQMSKKSGNKGEAPVRQRALGGGRGNER